MLNRPSSPSWTAAVDFDEATLNGIAREVRKVWKDLQRRVCLPGEPHVPNVHGEDDCLEVPNDGLSFDVHCRFESLTSPAVTLTTVTVYVGPDLTASLLISDRNLTVPLGCFRDWTPEQVYELFARGLDVAAVLHC